MEDKITIIEGPPPTFEATNEGWVLGLNESPNLANIAVTRLRTFNGQALVERCYRAWRGRVPIHLEYRQSDGLNNEAPIIAARNVTTQEGDLLLLWVRLTQDTELEIGYDDEDDDDHSQDPF